MNPDAIHAALSGGSPDERRAVVDALPPNDFKQTAGALLASDNPATRVIGMCALIRRYCDGPNPDVAADLALATHRFAVTMIESRPDSGLLLFTVSGIALQYVTACMLLGRSDEVIRFADEWIPYYEARGESENLPALKVARIGALLECNRIDEVDAGI